MRKTISISEGLLSSSSSIKSRQRVKIMNEILYLIRKLTKLARRAQTISESCDEDLSKELAEIEEAIKELEDEIS